MPSILISRARSLLSYRLIGQGNLRLDWNLSTTDSSGSTGITLFDFDGDGIQEIVYRDMTHIKIIDGSSNNPFVISQSVCRAPTANEFPIVADIDNNEEAKICVVCTGPAPKYNDAKLTIFGPPNGQHWAPARPLWNQYAYNPVQINDDLTVPRLQKNQATYKNGKYNNFMQQESLLDENGFYKKPAASLTGKINSIDLDPNTNEYILKFEIYNRADASLTADSAMPVSFYNGDPSSGGTLIGVYHTLKKIDAGDSLLNLEYRFIAANLSRVFMVVNTQRNTTGAFEPKDFNILECDYTDNTFQTTAPPIIINPDPCKPDFSDTSLCFINEKFISSPLQIEKKWVTLDSVNIHCAPLVADIDSNCTPELLSSVSHVQKIEIFDTEFGIFKSSFDTDINAISFSPTLICDIDKDGIYEIIIHIMDRGTGPIQMRDRLVCYDLLGNIKWISSDRVELYYNKSIGYPYPGPLSIADFNQDGIPELFVSNLIFNAQTGVLLIRGGDNGVGTGRDSIYPPMSVAADLDANPTDLELAAGFTIYKVILTNLNGQSGNMMIPNNIKINSTTHDGVTSVADINLDGQLDVIVYSRITFNSFILYVYTLFGNTPVLLASSILNGGSKFISSPVISNVNNINLSIIIARTFELLSFRYDGSPSLVLEWTFKTNDHSGFCNATVFDLNGDGVQEIMYRDETDFYILNLIANQPTVFKKFNCYSSTGHEMPIVFGSGFNSEARVCVVCNNSWRSSFGNLTVFGPPDGQHWAPARPLWNQYAYNPLQINDDLTVPQNQKNQATYKNGKYNNFMQQESLLDENGYYKRPAASLTGLIHCVDYDLMTDSFTVRFELHNRGDASRVADVNLPVSFYGANPELDTALLGVYLTKEIIRPGDSLRDLIFKFSASDLSRIYLVVNTRRNTIGPFDSTHFDQPECDYTDNFYYIIDLPKIQRDSVSICEGSTYMFYDTTLYDAGKYHRSLKNQKGCDSLIVMLDLSLSNMVRTQTGISVCEEYDWNGKMLTQSGIYTDTSLTVGGCDSIVILDLTVFFSSNSINRIATCDSYLWNGQTYTQSGQYIFNGQTENGCDSTVTLELIIHPSSNSINRIATCGSYLWNGNNYTQTGIYEFKTQNSVGCDSTAILDLTIDSIIRQQISHTSCDRYIWNGQTLSQSGTYTHQDISQAGCDSIVTLDLKLLQSTNSNSKINACDQFTWNGNVYTQSGTYQFSDMNSVGCDSVATLELTLLLSSNSINRIATCESYLWNGNNYTQTGTYEFKTLNSLGCDSTATLELTILPIHQNNIQESACDQFIWNGITYDQSGNYSFNTKNQFGCDSSITLELEILKSSSANISLSTCDSLVFQGQTLKESGTYPFTIRNAAGCDSVILLNLSINSDQQISSVSSCDPYRWDVDGQNYAQSGRYLKTFTNSKGCDSIHILDFKRLPSHLINEKAEVCGPFFWPVTNTLLDQSGLYSHPLQTTEGCDSLLNLELIIHPHFIRTDTVISQTDYIWPVNNTNYTISGNYEEQYSSEFGCDSIHRLILIIKNEQGIYYPNVLIPGGISGGFTIFDNLFTIASITTLSIYDRWGSQVWQKHNFAPNDPTLGWDGRFKGQHVVPGVYTWHAQLSLKDGTYQTVKGDVTVVR
ncbi:MAG: gliding motility-associated C-terminal domain-containing protein [Saprospiraceae bacterium]|nr:gliding motility-associated C-terminal domain-containing protein [Saprospiraceae bacterium]